MSPNPPKTQMADADDLHEMRDRETNPYSSAVVQEGAKGSAQKTPRSGILSTTVRRIALGLFAAPLLVAPLLSYWTFHLAGSWFVSTDIDPEQRRALLGLSYSLLMASVIATCAFLGLLLLFIDRYRRRVTGVLLIPATICFIPAVLFFVILLMSFLENG